MVRGSVVIVLRTGIGVAVFYQAHCQIYALQCFMAVVPENFHFGVVDDAVEAVIEAV